MGQGAQARPSDFVALEGRSACLESKIQWTDSAPEGFRLLGPDSTLARSDLDASAVVMMWCCSQLRRLDHTKLLALSVMHQPGVTAFCYAKVSEVSKG